jgi:hypothetical protein
MRTEVQPVADLDVTAGCNPGRTGKAKQEFNMGLTAAKNEIVRCAFLAPPRLVTSGL